MAFGNLRGFLEGAANSLTTNPLTATGSVAVVTGDLVFAVIGQQTNLTVTAVGDSLGNAYFAVNAGTDGGAVTGRAFYSRVTVGGTLTTASATTTASSDNAAFVAAVIEGPFAVSPLDAAPANTIVDLTSPFTCPSTGVLAQARQAVLAWAVAGNNAVWAATPPNLLARTLASQTVLHTIIGYQAVNATTSVAPEFTGTNPTSIVLGTASFKAAALTVTMDAGMTAEILGGRRVQPEVYSEWTTAASRNTITSFGFLASQQEHHGALIESTAVMPTLTVDITAPIEFGAILYDTTRPTEFLASLGRNSTIQIEWVGTSGTSGVSEDMAIPVEFGSTVAGGPRPFEFLASIQGNYGLPIEWASTAGADVVGNSPVPIEFGADVSGEVTPFEFLSSQNSNYGLPIEWASTLTPGGILRDAIPIEFGSTMAGEPQPFEFQSGVIGNATLRFEFGSTIAGASIPLEFLSSKDGRSPAPLEWTSLAGATTGTIRDATLPIEFGALVYGAPTPLEFLSSKAGDSRIPFELLAGPRKDSANPLEFTSVTTGLTRDAFAPLEFLGERRIEAGMPAEWALSQDRSSPVLAEWLATQRRDAPLPGEFRALQARDFNLPLEWAGTLGVYGLTLAQIEAIAVHTRDSNLPLEWLTQQQKRDSWAPGEWQTTQRGDILTINEFLATQRRDLWLPTEWAGALGVIIDGVLPVEFSLNTRRDLVVPAGFLVEQRGDASVLNEWLASQRRDPAALLELLASQRSESALPFEWSGITGVVTNHSVPIEFIMTAMRAESSAPMEFMTALLRNAGVPIETLARALRDVGMPTEWDGAISISIDGLVPIEFRSNIYGDQAAQLELLTTRLRDESMQIELLASLRRDPAALLELLASQRSDARLTLEWTGISNVVIDRILPIEFIGWQLVSLSGPATVTIGDARVITVSVNDGTVRVLLVPLDDE